MTADWRPHLSIATLVTAVALASGLVLSYVLTHRGAAYAGLALAVPFVAAWIIRRPGNGFLLAVVVLLTVPYWYAHVWLVAPIVATGGLVMGVARTRLRAVDLAFFSFTVVVAAGWIFHPELGISARGFIEGMLPLGYYVWSRLTITESLLHRLQWGLLLAASFGACTVLYDAVRGTSAFIDPLLYEWAGSSSAIFRAGGIFGGSPSAAIALSVILLASVGLYRHRPRIVLGMMALIFAAIVVTLDRAGMIGLAAGVALLAVLAPYRHWGRVVFAALALSIPVYAVTSSSSARRVLSSSRIVSLGILRTSTVTQRANLAAMTLPLLDDSTSHLLFGRGFDSLEARTGLDANLIADPTLYLAHDGPNEDYLRAVLEQGLVGLTAMLAWFGGSLWLGVRTCRRLPKQSRERMVVAGLTAATLCYAVAAAAHDVTHNNGCLSVVALITGTLVSVCTLFDASRSRVAEPLSEDGRRRSAAAIT
jgi:hypothetical protein